MKLRHFHEYLEQAVAHRGTIPVPYRAQVLWVSGWTTGHACLSDIRFMIRDQLGDDLDEAQRNEEISKEISATAAQKVSE